VVDLSPSVAVFDIDLPPGVAYLRSLARAGVDVQTFSDDRMAAGRSSRFAGRVKRCPPVMRTDEFVAFVADGISDGSLELIAPTSDYVAFAVAAAVQKLGIDAATVGHPEPSGVCTALFKADFYTRMEQLGFPVPAWALVSDLAGAEAAAERIGYPVVLKPRGHAGVGLSRGKVVGTPAAMVAAFKPWWTSSTDHETVLAIDPDIAVPLVQRYFELGTIDVISVSGYLRRDGSVGAVSYARKVSQSPRRLGVGTMFEPVDPPAFAEAAVAAVRSILGSGVFELEIIVDRRTGEHFALDLNPRGFGQISLDIGRGFDLPVLWYNDVTGADLASGSRRRRPAELWHDAIGSYVGFGVRFVRGPRRLGIAQHAWGRLVAPTVGAMHDWGDPLPSVRFVIDHFRHPRAFLRPFLVDIELNASDEEVPQVLRDPGHQPSDP
jgi:predicted ATP-grasp superfamily ATP-dependent carboligase